MSEEFEINVKFQLPDPERFELLESLVEHFDMGEIDKANQLMSGPDSSFAQKQVRRATPKGSAYRNRADLAEMFLETYNSSIDNLILKALKTAGGGTLIASGEGRDGIDFGASMVLVLIALGAVNIHATAHSPSWKAKWRFLSGKPVEFTFNTSG